MLTDEMLKTPPVYWPTLLICGIAAALTLFEIVMVSLAGREFRAHGLNGEIAHAHRGYRRRAWWRIAISLAMMAASWHPTARSDRVARWLMAVALISLSLNAIADRRVQQEKAADRLSREARAKDELRRTSGGGAA